MSELSSFMLLIMPALVIVGGLTDVTSFKIPNWISAALILAFIPAAIVVGADFRTIGLHLAIGAGALAFGMFMWSLRWIGGGDAKLFAASALWLGWPAIGIFAFVTAICGGALSIFILNLRSNWGRAFVPVGPPWVERLRRQDGDVPYGVAIAVGALAAFPGSGLVNLLAG